MGRALRILTGGWLGTAQSVFTRGYFQVANQGRMVMSAAVAKQPSISAVVKQPSITVEVT